MNNTDHPDLQTQIAIARIIFLRLAGQISAASLTEQTWLAGVEGFRTQPELFPLIEACMDAAAEILEWFRTGRTPPG